MRAIPYQLYEVITSVVNNTDFIPSFDRRKVIAQSAKDAIAQVTDLDPGEFITEVKVILSLDGVAFPEPK